VHRSTIRPRRHPGGAAGRSFGLGGSVLDRETACSYGRNDPSSKSWLEIRGHMKRRGTVSTWHSGITALFCILGCSGPSYESASFAAATAAGTSEEADGDPPPQAALSAPQEQPTVRSARVEVSPLPKLVVPFYVWPGKDCSSEAWKALLSSKVAARALVILNPQSGPAPAGTEADLAFAACAKLLRSKGGKALGYISTKNTVGDQFVHGLRRCRGARHGRLLQA
jgi:hypothetical protein